eukprot:112097_1
MKKVLGVILGGLLLLPVVSNAADAQKAADNKKPVNSWTCEDFLAVDESFQPTAVGFAEALNNKDKPEDAVLDVQGIATVTPAIVQACTQDKQANFKDKVKGEWDKIMSQAKSNKMGVVQLTILTMVNMMGSGI